MSSRITIRLPEDLARWLQELSASTGVRQGALIRSELERMRARMSKRPFMRLAGSVGGPPNLAAGKAFARRL